MRVIVVWEYDDELSWKQMQRGQGLVRRTAMYILALCNKGNLWTFSNGVCTDHNDIYRNKTLERPHVCRGVGGGSLQHF